MEVLKNTLGVFTIADQFLLPLTIVSGFKHGLFKMAAISNGFPNNCRLSSA